MKGLTYSQPWIWAVFDEIANKDLENRTWAFPVEMIGKPFACHAASSSFDDDGLYALWGRGLKTPDMFTKGAIIGVATVDRIVTEARTLTPNQASYYMGPNTPDGKVVYGHILVDRRKLSTPIPWDGALGLWPVPAAIQEEIDTRIDGSSLMTVATREALESARIKPLLEPGKHTYFTVDNLASCAWCGHIQPKPNAKRGEKPCKGGVDVR